MKYFGANFIGRVFHIKIEGSIDQNTTNFVAAGLEKSWPYKPEAFLITINSTGGSLTQAKTITDMLKLHSHRLNVPIVSFVEDSCFGCANVILTAAVRCYAHNFSLLGDMGYVWSQANFKKLAQKYDIKRQMLYDGSNSIKINPFEDVSSDSQKWIKNYIFSLEHELQINIINNRQHKLTQLGISRQDIQYNLFNSGIVQISTAIKYGLIDGIRTIDDQINERYSGKKIKLLEKKKSPFQKLRNNQMLDNIL